jgi:hypothetical protein
MELQASFKLKIFQKYIGKKVWLENLLNVPVYKKNQVFKLTGVKEDAIQLYNPSDYSTSWYTIKDTRQSQFNFRLLLKPLTQLTPQIQETAKTLPAPPFIVQYYIDLGFDLPIFFKPGHQGNQRNAYELNLATYQTEDEILAGMHIPCPMVNPTGEPFYATAS